MRAHIPGRYAALALLLGGLACAGNKAGSDDGTVVAQDSTQVNDTSAYKGQERDTTAMTAPADTTSRNVPDTSSYSPTAPADTTSYVPQTPTDTTSSAIPADTTSSSTGVPSTPTDSTSGQSGMSSDSSSASPSTGWSTDTTAGMTHDSAGKANAQ